MIPGDAIHHLDPNEIASSLRRADDLIASGDLAAARLVLRRAANAGDARAAMTLAGTYDPVILEKLGVHGFVPDVAMARVGTRKPKVRIGGGASAARTARKQAAIIGAPYDTFQSHVYWRRIFAANRTDQVQPNSDAALTRGTHLMGRRSQQRAKLWASSPRLLEIFVCLSFFLFLISLTVPCVLFWLKAKSRWLKAKAGGQLR